MKIFVRDSKTNFVDENNVLVGYDSYQSCCEYADWFISDKLEEKIPDPLTQPDDMPGWLFDPYFQHGVSGAEFDGGGMVVFKLKKDGQEKFLHLFNCHNGYYGHGFEMKSGEQQITEGCL